MNRASRARGWGAVFMLSLTFLAALGAAHAVDVNARIKGVVSDPSGAAVVGAKITATNTATGVTSVTDSGTDGTYEFTQLVVGTYSITASASGFKTFTATGILLTIDQEYVENITLTVGQATETVNVQATAIEVDTTDMQLGNIVDSTEIVEMPLIGRALTGLELVLPGVQASSDRFGTYSVSGGQTQQESYLIDGLDINDVALNTPVINPNVDAIDEFNLLEGPLNAEYDRNSGGIVSSTVKHGANQFHGDAFEFYRDTFLNTANFYQHSVTTGKPTVSTFHQNIPGGTVGGPILKDKLFFFAAYQRTQAVVPEGAGNTEIYSTPLLAGNFSIDNGPAGTPPTASENWGQFAADPIPSAITVKGCTTAGETWAQCAYALNGIFPASSFNTVATALASKYLAPSLVPGCSSSSLGPCDYIFNEIETESINQYIGRIDFNLGPNDKFFGDYIYQNLYLPETIPFTGANVPGFPEYETEHHNLITIDYVHQFSPTLVNDLSAHYVRFNFAAVEPVTPVAPSSAGFNISPEDTAGEGLPVMGVSSPTGLNFALGFSANGPQPRIDQNIQLDDSVSKVLGKHTLKFGYDGRRFTVWNPFAADNDGDYSFNPSSSTYSTGDGGLDFLLGIPGTYEQGSGATIEADAFLNYIYGQDSWKVTPTLTLDYGLGYSIDTPLHNNQYGGEGIACLAPGVQSTIFPTAPVGVVYPGEQGCNNAGYAVTHHDEFGPRIGFAWAPDLGALSGGAGGKKFSIRGGLGVYYNRTEEESSLQTLETPPFGLTSYGASDFGGSPELVNPFTDINGLGSEKNPFPYAFPTKGEKISYGTWANLEPLSISSYTSNFRAPYAYNFQLSVEREFPSQVVMRLSYVGSVAHRNQNDPEANYETAAGHAACLAGNEYSPYVGATLNCESERNLQSFLFPQNTLAGAVDPNTGVTGVVSVGVVSSESSSNYNSFQADIRKSLTHGLLFQVSYTFAHALDNGSSFEDSGFGIQRGYNQWVPSLNYGDSAYDARQRLVVAPLYIVPKFAGASYSFKNLAIAGWEVSGITTLATGFPYDISYEGASSRSLWCTIDFNFYACPDIPNEVAAPTFGNPRIRQNNPSLSNYGSSGDITNTTTAFAAEPIGSFGNIHRNPYHGPGINNTNMILAKNFMLVPDRNISLQMRIESDNVFNHTQFSNPNGDYASGGFGFISGAAASRASQLAAKIYF